MLPEGVPPFEPRSNGDAVRSEELLVSRNVSKTFLGTALSGRLQGESLNLEVATHAHHRRLRIVDQARSKHA